MHQPWLLIADWEQSSSDHIQKLSVKVFEKFTPNLSWYLKKPEMNITTSIIHRVAALTECIIKGDVDIAVIINQLLNVILGLCEKTSSWFIQKTWRYSFHEPTCHWEQFPSASKHPVLISKVILVIITVELLLTWMLLRKYLISAHKNPTHSWFWWHELCAYRPNLCSADRQQSHAVRRTGTRRDIGILPLEPAHVHRYQIIYYRWKWRRTKWTVSSCGLNTMGSRPSATIVNVFTTTSLGSSGTI